MLPVTNALTGRRSLTGQKKTTYRTSQIADKSLGRPAPLISSPNIGQIWGGPGTPACVCLAGPTHHRPHNCLTKTPILAPHFEPQTHSLLLRPLLSLSNSVLINSDVQLLQRPQLRARLRGGDGPPHCVGAVQGGHIRQLRIWSVVAAPTPTQRGHRSWTLLAHMQRS